MRLLPRLMVVCVGGVFSVTGWMRLRLLPSPFPTDWSRRARVRFISGTPWSHFLSLFLIWHDWPQAPIIWNLHRLPSRGVGRPGHTWQQVVLSVVTHLVLQTFASYPGLQDRVTTPLPCPTALCSALLELLPIGSKLLNWLGPFCFPSAWLGSNSRSACWRNELVPRLPPPLPQEIAFVTNFGAVRPSTHPLMHFKVTSPADESTSVSNSRWGRPLGNNSLLLNGSFALVALGSLS